MFHYFQNLSPDDQHFDDFWHSQKSNACLISGISDYDLGGEGDLFKAAEPIIEQPLVTLDHMTSVMSMILCGEDDKVTDAESLQNEDFLSNLFYEYKDMFASESSEVQLPTTKDDSITVQENVGKLAESVSSVSLSSVDGGEIWPSSMNFNEMELGEGYIKPQPIGDHTATETRMQKLSRYRDKKTRRNFGRKIKEGVGGWSATDQRKVCQDRRNRHLEKVINQMCLIIRHEKSCSYA